MFINLKTLINKGLIKIYYIYLLLLKTNKLRSPLAYKLLGRKRMSRHWGGIPHRREDMLTSALTDCHQKPKLIQRELRRRSSRLRRGWGGKPTGALGAKPLVLTKHRRSRNDGDASGGVPEGLFIQTDLRSTAYGFFLIPGQDCQAVSEHMLPSVRYPSETA